MEQPTPGAASRPPGGAQMPPWIPRLVMLLVATFFGVLFVLTVLPKVGYLLRILVISLFLSFALEPGVNWLQSHGWRRGLATALILLGALVLGILLIALMVPLVVQQVQGIIADLPGWLDRLSTFTQSRFHVDLSTQRLLEQLKHLNVSVASFGKNIAGNLLGFGAAVVGAVFEAFTIGLFTFYLVADAPRLRRSVCSLLPPARQREVLRTWEIAVQKTGGYFYSRLLLATISAVGVLIAMSILHIPFALPLAIFSGLVSQFIPVVGTYLAAIMPLFVAVLYRPFAALVLLIYYLLYQQLENFVLSPRISARTMALHPAVAFGAAIAGASLAGAVGAFLALPAAAIVQAAASERMARHDVVTDSGLALEGSPHVGANSAGGAASGLARLLRRRRPPPAPGT